jgi:hypothetical protein
VPLFDALRLFSTSGVGTMLKRRQLPFEHHIPGAGEEISDYPGF